MSDQGKDKASLIAKIKALMSKTLDAGATEAEALSAMNKAYELLEKYQLSLSDLEFKEEGAGETSYRFDEVANSISVQVGKFCDCVVLIEKEQKEFVKEYRGRGRKPKDRKNNETEWREVEVVKFIGSKSDAMFAEWLLNALVGFVHGEVLHQELFGGLTSSYDYQMGICRRLNRRMLDEVRKRRENVENSNSTALIPLKNVLIDEHLAKTFRERPTYARIDYNPTDKNAFNAGLEKGNTPALRRPIEREMMKERKQIL